MKWRCVGCGCPHDTNSPPCTECGHGTFERAVVRQTRRCATCGEPAGEEADFCRACGFGSFEPLDGPSGESSTSYVEFRCRECGKGHPRHTPPCDRCGHMGLESTRVEDVDVEDYVPDGPRFGVTRELLAIVGVIVLAVAAVGVGGVPLNPLDGGGGWVDDIDSSAVERAVHDRISVERTSRGLAPPERADTLERVARYHNRDMVESGYFAPVSPDGENTSDRFDRFGYDCDAPEELMVRVDGTESWPGDGRPNAGSLTAAIVESWLDDRTDRSVLLRDGPVDVGVDARVSEEGYMYVTVVVC